MAERTFPIKLVYAAAIKAKARYEDEKINIY